MISVIAIILQLTYRQAGGRSSSVVVQRSGIPPENVPLFPPNNDTVEMHSLRKSEIEANTKLDLALRHR
jgi:hypothetical protein